MCVCHAFKQMPEQQANAKTIWTLATLCHEACLHAGPHLDLCHDVALNGAKLGGPLWTWQCKEGEFVVLLRDSTESNAPLVYVCSTGMVFFARPGFEFSVCDEEKARDKGFPGRDTVQGVIGQFVVDRDSSGQQVGRLLAFDVVSGGNAQERHEALMRLQCGPGINKQWCGNKEALTPAFLQTLPHATTGLIGLTACPYVYERD